MPLKQQFLPPNTKQVAAINYLTRRSKSILFQRKVNKLISYNQRHPKAIQYHRPKDKQRG